MDEDNFVYRTEEQLNNLNNEDLVQYAINLQEHRVEEKDRHSAKDLEKAGRKDLIEYCLAISPEELAIPDEGPDEENSNGPEEEIEEEEDSLESMSNKELIDLVQALRYELRVTQNRLSRAKRRGTPRGMRLG